MRLGLNARDVEAKKAKNEKKSVECLLCHGPHKLQKCLKKSVVEWHNGSDKIPIMLSLIMGRVETKRAKRSKKK